MINNKKNIAFIFARGGSKGLPRKNIKLFNGEPLIKWTIDQAFQSNICEQVIVSTDDEEIAKVSEDSGAKVPFLRPKNLASDESREWLAWQHCVNELYENQDYNFISLPCVCPLRTPDDIRNAVSYYENRTSDLVFTIAKSDRSPYVNMVEQDKDGFVNLSKSVDTTKIYRRQDSPIVFNIVPSVYVTSPKYILSNNSMWDGKISGFEVPHERGIDIDSEIDFNIAEFLHKNIHGKK